MNTTRNWLRTIYRFATVFLVGIILESAYSFLDALTTNDVSGHSVSQRAFENLVIANGFFLFMPTILFCALAYWLLGYHKSNQITVNGVSQPKKTHPITYWAIAVIIIFFLYLRFR